MNRRAALVALIAGVVTFGGRPTPAVVPAESLRGEIAACRMRADDRGALRAADSLEAVLRARGSAHADEIGDAQRLRATLRDVLAHDRAAQLELACADRLAQRIDPLVTAGQLTMADRCARSEWEIRERILGPRHPETAASIARVASVASARGQIPAARSLLERSLAIREATLEPRHPDVATNLADLAWVEKHLSLRSEAERHFRTALALRRERFGPEDPGVADCLVGLANIRRSGGRYAESRALLRQALAIQRRSVGDQTEAVAGTRMVIGLVDIYLDRFTEAERELRTSYEVRRARLGPNHQSLAVTLSLLGVALQAQGRYVESERALRASAAIGERARLEAPPGAARALRFAMTMYDGLAADLIVSGRESEAWSALEHGQARALTEALAPTARPAATGGALAQGPLAFSLARVQRALMDHRAIIGWLDVTPGMREPHSAWGYVVRDHGPVHWVRLRPRGLTLGPQVPFHTPPLVRQLASAAAWPVPAESLGALPRIGREAWDERIAPLVPFLSGADEVVVVNSGAIRSGVEAMVDPSGRYASDRFAISYAPSGTAYAWLHERAQGRPARHRSLIVADPAFSREQLAAMQSHPETPRTLPNDLPAPDARLLRGARAGNLDALSRLPRVIASRWEAARMARCLPEPTVLLGADASKSRLEAMSRSGDLGTYDIVHVASHFLLGFPTEQDAVALAGVDASGQPLGDAGAALLTAGEIDHVLALGPGLVTLSGCNSTGSNLGYGNGNLELGVAMFRAGATSLVTNAFRADDRATALFMSRFYENLTGAYADDRGEGVGTALPASHALQEARRWLRTWRDPDGRTPYRHPAYWAGFSLTGDPD